MNKKMFGSMVLCCVYVFVYLWTRYLFSESALGVVNELVNQCQFSPGQEYRAWPYPKSIDWCVTSEHEPMTALLQHLHLQAIEQDLDAAFGAEFGSNVKALYLKASKTYMINPRYVNKSDTLTRCVDSFGTHIVERSRHASVTVKYLNQDYEQVETTFEHAAACILQAIMDVL